MLFEMVETGGGSVTEKDLQIQELKKEIQKLKEQVPQWIPVKERLPERNGYHLVAIDTGEISVRWFSTRKRKFFDAIGEVLAWVPLPGMYKPEEETK
jgi:hypothetical protein